jgi:hypothetical protein
MKFRASEPAKNWVEVTSAPGTTPLDPKAAKEAKDQLAQLLSTTLLSENLVVLTGLGTSLCLRDATWSARSFVPVGLLV